MQLQGKRSEQIPRGLWCWAGPFKESGSGGCALAQASGWMGAAPAEGV